MKVEEIKRLWVEEMKNDVEIGEMLGCSASEVMEVRKAHGIGREMRLQRGAKYFACLGILTASAVMGITL